MFSGCPSVCMCCVAKEHFLGRVPCCDAVVGQSSLCTCRCCASDVVHASSVERHVAVSSCQGGQY